VTNINAVITNVKFDTFRMVSACVEAGEKMFVGLNGDGLTACWTVCCGRPTAGAKQQAIALITEVLFGIEMCTILSACKDRRGVS
jgi:hypothetical protein